MNTANKAATPKDVVIAFIAADVAADQAAADGDEIIVAGSATRRDLCAFAADRAFDASGGHGDYVAALAAGHISYDDRTTERNDVIAAFRHHCIAGTRSVDDPGVQIENIDVIGLWIP